MGSKTGIFRKPFSFILLSVFILWIILFGLILPENNILPGPLTVLTSFPALFEDYNFLTHFFTTISAIYLPGILAFLFIYLIREFIFRETGIAKYFIEFISQLSVFVPALLIAVLVVFWFPTSFFIEYVFSFIISVVWGMKIVHLTGEVRNENYFVAFKSLGGDKAFLDKNILWNEIKPEVIKSLFHYHLQLWTLILIFEFIHDSYGLGVILRRTLNYHDFSVLLLMIILIPVLILGGYYFLKYLENKFIFWEAE